MAGLGQGSMALMRAAIAELRETIESHYLKSNIVLVHGMPTVGKSEIRHQLVNSYLSASGRQYVDIDAAVFPPVGRPMVILQIIADSLHTNNKVDFYLLNQIRTAKSGYKKPAVSTLPLAGDSQSSDAISLFEGLSHVPGLSYLYKGYTLVDRLRVLARHTSRRHEMAELKRELKRSLTAAELQQLMILAAASDMREHLLYAQENGALYSSSAYVILLDSLEVLYPHEVCFLTDLASKVPSALFILFSTIREPWTNCAHKPGDGMKAIEIEMLSEEQLVKVLREAGIEDSGLHERILARTYGHPFSVGLFLDQVALLQERQVRLTVQEMEQFPIAPVSELRARMIEAAKSPVKSISLDQLCRLSAPRTITADIVRLLLGPKEDIEHLMSGLLLHSLARRVNATTLEYRLNPLFREVLQFDYAEEKPNEFLREHDDLARFFRERCTKSTGLNRARNFRELLYHEEARARKRRGAVFPELKADLEAPWTVDYATDEDYRQSRNIARAVFNDFADEVPYLVEWFHKNPKILRVLKDATKRVIGYTLILPISTQTAELLESHALMEHQLRPEHILNEAESESATVLYFSGIAVEPSYPRRTAAAARLINDAFESVISWQRRFCVERVLTTVMSEEGQRIAQKLGFKTKWSEPPQPGVELFAFAELDLKSSSTKSRPVLALRNLLGGKR